MSVRLRLCGLLSMLILASTPGSRIQAQVVPQTLKIVLGIDADTLDPAAQTTATVMNMVDYIYETLVNFDFKQNKVVPMLATHWEASADGLTHTFTLRNGVSFHDGTPFDAEAVKFTFERLLDPRTRAPLRDPLSLIKEVKIIDPMTVRFILSRPIPSFLAQLAVTVAAIISPTAAGKAGASLGRDPTGGGTGPYVFKEWVHGSHILLTRNPNYWGRKPLFEEVMFRVVPDAGVRETMLLAGDAHIAILPPAPDVRRLQANPNFNVIQAPTARVIFVGMNTQWGPLKDVRVRQAMNFAINKRAILQSMLFNLGTAIDSPCSSMLIGHSPVQPGGWPFDVIKARQLLSEAGYPNGFEVGLITPTGRYIQDFQFAQAIAAQLRNINVRANVRTMEWPSYTAALGQPLDRSSLQMFVLGWTVAILDCGSDVLFPMFHSTQQPPRGLSATFYKNTKVDQLLDKASTEIDEAKRNQFYKEVQATVWRDAPWIFLWSQTWYLATVRNLQGVAIQPNEFWDAVYATWK